MTDLEALMASSVTLRDFGREAAGQILQLVPADMAGVFARADNAGFLLIGGAGRIPEELGSMDFQSGSDGVLSRVAQRLKPVLVSAQTAEITLDPDLYGLLGRLPCLFVPVTAGNGCNAVFFAAACKDEFNYTRDHLETLTRFAREMAMPLEVLRLRDELSSESWRAAKETERRAKELAVIHEIIEEAGRMEDPRDLAAFSFPRILKAVEFDAGGAVVLAGKMRKVYVYPDRATRKGVVNVATEMFNVVKELEKYRFRRSVLDIVSLLPLSREQGEEGQEPQEAHGACLSIPVLYDGRLQGALAFFRRSQNPFSADEKAFLGVVTQEVVTALRRMSSSRKKQWRGMRSVLTSMLEGILMVDKGLRYEVMNPAGEQLLRLCAPPGMKERLEALGCIEGPDLLNPIFDGSKTIIQREINALSDPGRRISVSVSAVKSSAGKVRGAVVILRDVTQERNLQEQLAQAEKMSSIGQMISGIAHELNNPLTSVIGFSELLMNREGVAEDLRDDLKKIYQEADRARKIIQNLLTFARRRISRRKPLDLNYILEKALEFRAYDLMCNNIEVVRRFQAPLPKILADRYQLQQVFINFFINSQQAMRPQGGGRITLTTQASGDHVTAAVADNGPGIPKERLKRIFDPFFTTKPVGEGTGLGLSIAYGIITDMGGKVGVESEEGVGTTVIVELPVHEEKEPDTTSDGTLLSAEGLREPLESPEMPPAEALPKFSRSLKVLALDDEPFIVDLIVDILSQEGFNVDTASNGKDGLEMIGAADYDLIICDLKMPMFSGQELFAYLEKNRPELAKRIMFITGDVANPSTRSFLKLSKAMVLEKPFRPATLLRLIAKSQERRQQAGL